jgi:hypothetical protein
MTLNASWISKANGAKYTVKHRTQNSSGSSDYEVKETIESSWYAGSGVADVINERVSKNEYVGYNSGTCASDDSILD